MLWINTLSFICYSKQIFLNPLSWILFSWFIFLQYFIFQHLPYNHAHWHHICYGLTLYPLSAIAFTFPLLPCPDDFWDRHCLSGVGGEPDVVIVDIVYCNRFCSFVSFKNLLNLLWSINNLLSGLLIVGECKRHRYHWKVWRKGVTTCNHHDVCMIWWSLSIQDDRCSSKPFLHPQSK